ncbi:MAG TPA: RtcB family protein [Thermoanaerobaculia bacterium]|nr:RtcB family protein [Thermoanaerobaculia bacterium]
MSNERAESSAAGFREVEPNVWEIEATGAMRVPGRIFASRELVDALDEKVREQVSNVAALPGIVGASLAMPDAHWGYGFPIGGVAAFDPDRGGIVSAGGVGFDISCGVRTFTTGMKAADLGERLETVAHDLYRTVPAGVGWGGSVKLTVPELDEVLAGGAVWAVEKGWGEAEDLERIEEGGRMAGAEPSWVSRRAKERQLHEVGSLGSGNHYLELQVVERIFDAPAAGAFRVAEGDLLVTIHCGSRGLGHQIGTEYLQKFVSVASRYGIALPDRELACAPIRSPEGEEYLGAMRAGINCALANRQVIGALVRKVFARHFPSVKLRLLYDVSHNTCKAEEHEVGGSKRLLFVHRKGATRAFGPGHPDVPLEYRDVGQPVLIGGTMGTASYVLAGTSRSESRAFSSSCHGAGRKMSRTQAKTMWEGKPLIRELAGKGIIVKSHTAKGAAEEAPGAYKDVDEVARVAEEAGLSRRVARVLPIACVKG